MMAAPIYLSTFAVTRAPFDVDIAPETYGVLREDLKVSFEDYLNVEPLSNQLGPEHPFALIDHVGAIAAGPGLSLTFDRMEVAEYAARSIHMAKTAGYELKPLSKEELALTDGG